MIEKKLFGNGWDDIDEYEKQDNTENLFTKSKKKQSLFKFNMEKLLN